MEEIAHSNLQSNFDVLSDGSRITHVMFLKPDLIAEGNMRTLFGELSPIF